MERRYILFIISVVLVLGTHFALRQWVFPPKPQPAAQKDGAPKEKQPKQPVKDGKQPVQDPVDDAQAKGQPKHAAVKDPAAPVDRAAVAQPARKAPSLRVTLGSLDPASGSRELVTISSRGAALERVELGGDEERRYFDTDDKTGYLGHLGLTATNGGCQVSAVGHGTPAFLARETGGKIKGGLAVGDVITAIDGASTDDPKDVTRLLLNTCPGREVSIEVVRKTNGKATNLTFRAKLTRHPLELIRPEVHIHDDGTETDPPSLLLTLDRVAGHSVRRGDREIRDLPSLQNENWELTDSAPDSAEFTFRLDDAALRKIGQAGSLKIVKRYSLARRGGVNGVDLPGYALRLQIEIHSDLTEPTPLAYRLSGPNGLPLEGWWYLTKLHPKMFYSAGARDVVWRHPEYAQRLLGCREIYEGDVEARKEDDVYASSLLETNKPQPMEYVGVDTQFFAAMIKPHLVGKNPILFRQAFAESVQNASKLKPEYSRTTNVSVVLVSDAVNVAPQGVLRHQYDIFLGPKDPDVLTAYQLESLIEKGWMIFKYPTNLLSGILHFLYNLTGNYGIAIILLTVFVRACMLPLSIKQAKNAAKMQELAPEIKKIKEKYAGDTEKQMKAQSELFKKHNHNMFAGCLPVFVQLPIFIGLYRCLSVDIALRDASLFPGFWWASNLAGPDKLFYWEDYLWAMLGSETGYLGPYFNILPVVTCGLFILQQKLFMPPATDEQSEMQQKMMMYMTVFMGVMFFKVPAGLCIYFIVSTSWSIIERTFLPKYKPAEGSAAAEAKPAAAPPSTNGSPGKKSGAKAKRK